MRWDRRSLRTRTALLVTSGILVALSLLGAAAWRGLDELAKELLDERKLLAQSVAARADDAFRGALENLHALPAVTGAHPGESDGAAERNALRALFLKSRLLSGVALLDSGGAVVWQEPPRAGAPAPGLGATVAVAARTGVPAVSTLQREPAPRIHVVVPLRDVHGAPAGFGAASLDMGSPALTRVLAPYQHERGSADLLDAEGQVAASSDPARGRDAPVVAPTLPRRPAAALLDGELRATAPLAFLPLTLLLRQEDEAALAPIRRFRRRLLILAPFLVGTAILFGLGAARSLTGPLSLLGAAAARIADGDLSQPIPPLSGDEVGRLGKSLEAMRRSLAASIEDLERRVAERTAAQGRLLRKLLTAQEDERKRIARDLHDQPCQTVAALGVGLDTALRSPDPKERLLELKGHVRRTLDDLHELIFALRPSVLDDLGLAAAVRWYAARCAGDGRPSIRCEIEGLERRLPPETEIAVFRAVQEALTNVLRHAGAESVLVQMAAGDDLLTVEIEDDGQGFDVASADRPSACGRGLGLLGMRERIELLGGHVTLESAPGAGTRLVFSVPIGTLEEKAVA